MYKLCNILYLRLYYSIRHGVLGISASVVRLVVCTNQFTKY